MMKVASRKIIEKKNKKKKDLIQAAYQLFLTKGVDQTSIDEIVKRADVAKGTFYLYFSDKNDLVDHIIIKSTGDIILSVYENEVKQDYDHFEDLVIALLDRIIEKLKGNIALLDLIHKNVSWSLYQKALREASGESLLDLLKKSESKYERNSHISDEEFERRMFILLELTTAVTYTSVVKNDRAYIDEMKPTLFHMIRKMIASE